MSEDAKTVRIEIRAELGDCIRALAEARSIPESELLERAIELYRYADELQANGSALAIVRGKQVVALIAGL